MSKYIYVILTKHNPRLLASFTRKYVMQDWFRKYIIGGELEVDVFRCTDCDKVTKIDWSTGKAI